MSKQTALADLQKLTDEEATVLNSDPDLLSAFKTKHGLDKPEPAGTWGTIKAGFKAASESPILKLSPIGLLGQAAPQALDQAAMSQGEKLSTELAKPDIRRSGMNIPFLTKKGEMFNQNPISPTVASGIGTVAAMMPTIAMTEAGPPVTDEAIIPDAAIATQRRALGFQKSMLKTPFARGQASNAAKISLESGVTSATGNPEVLLSKANNLAGKVGQKLGDIRESVGPQPLDNVLNALDDYKAARLKGASGGEWDAIAAKIEAAKQTVKGLVKAGTVEATPEMIKDTGIVDASGQAITKTVPATPGYVPPTSLKRIAEAKKEIVKTVNYLAENVSQADKKKIGGVIEKSIEKSIAESGGDIKTYKQLKPIYSAAKHMQKGLNNEVAAQEGNMAASLPSLVVGGPGKGVADIARRVGLTELAKRRGAGIMSSELMGAANAPRKFAVPIMNAVRPALTEDKAKEYLKKAKGNRDKARKMAVNDGYEIPVVE